MIKMAKIKQFVSSILLLILLLPLMTHAMTPEEKGLAIAKEWKKRDIGWVDYKADVKMVLKNKHGQKSERLFQYSTMEMTENGVRVDGDKVLVVFEKPRDVAGTALLTYSHFQRDDDQWLFLPAIKRTKRISSYNKSGSFVGSEISYEDITFQEVEKYTYKWVREEEYDGVMCDVVDRFPVDKKNTGYLYQRVWYDQEHVLIRKIDFYDRKNSLLKTQSFANFSRYLDDIWRAKDELFVNHQTGKSTELTWNNYEFHIGLSEMQFRKSALERLR